jgi:hypothetical protein
MGSLGRGLVATVLFAAIMSGAPGEAKGSAAVDAEAARGGGPLHALRFHTHHELGAVRLCVAHRAEPSTAAGNLFLTLWRSPGNPDALVILTRDGRLVWYRPTSSGVRDLKVVDYRGQRMLAYFDWSIRGYVLLDRHYRRVRRIDTVGYPTDMHELQLTRQGTAYIGSYHNLHRRTTGEWIRDYTVQEIDLHTGARLFEWHASDHVPLSASYTPRPRGGKAWDFFHGNSIEPPTPRDPTVIVSARHTSSIYGIDRRTGRIRWILGGKQDQFGLNAHRGWQFCGQHDARRIRGGITLFDDGHVAACPRHPARVLRYRLRVRSKRARLVQSIPSSDVEGVDYYPWGLGSARRLDGGHFLVSWGTVPDVTELTPRGHVVFDVRMRSYTYRAVRAKWFGLPTDRPAVVARRRGRDTVVWASWNGATTVHAWQVLAGATPDALRPTHVKVRWANFETTIHVPLRPAYVAVRALNGSGDAIGQSGAVKVR